MEYLFLVCSAHDLPDRGDQSSRFVEGNLFSFLDLSLQILPVDEFHHEIQGSALVEVAHVVIENSRNLQVLRSEDLEIRDLTQHATACRRGPWILKGLEYALLV